MTKDVISLSISVLLLFRHYISHKITFGAPSSGGVLCSACGAFICIKNADDKESKQTFLLGNEFKARNFFICRYFSFYDQLKFHAQLS